MLQRCCYFPVSESEEILIESRHSWKAGPGFILAAQLFQGFFPHILGVTVHQVVLIFFRDEPCVLFEFVIQLFAFPAAVSQEEADVLIYFIALQDVFLYLIKVSVQVQTFAPDEDGSADLKYVLEVARTVGSNMNKKLLFVTKSTVPVGTAKKVKAAIQDELKKRDLDISFDVASNPEFLKEGAAIKDFMSPDRVVVGIESEEAKRLMTLLYRPLMCALCKL